MGLKATWRLFQETFTEWNQDKASRLAASLAYYTIFSLAPLLVIVIAIAGSVFGDEAARGQITGQIQGLVGQEGAQFIEAAIKNTNQSGSHSGAIASLISLAVLLFGASGVFTELQDSLNLVWGVAPDPKQGFWQLIHKRVLSFGMILGIAFLLLVSLLVSALLSGINAYMSYLLPGVDELWQLGNNVVSLGVITLLFAMIFKFLPDIEVRWRDVLVGAALTSLLFTIGKFLIGVYLGNSSFNSTYGAAGSVIVVLVWVYYSAQILFFGAEFTQVYARRHGSHTLPKPLARSGVGKSGVSGERSPHLRDRRPPL